MIFALIQDGVVINKIVGEDQTSTEEICAIVHPTIDAVVRVDELDPVPDMGWLYDGTNFSAP